MRHVVIAGGGTGGHLFPGIAVAEELKRRYPRVDVTFVGTPRGLENRLLPPLGYHLELLKVSPLKGRAPVELGRSLARLPGALSAAAVLLRRAHPDLVIGLGGYASGPLLAAAATLGVKCALMEQNARVGMTNRLAARFVGRAYVSFPSTAADFPSDRVRALGNPVREVFRRAAMKAIVDPSGFAARGRSLLVLGGSQGAQPLNRALPGLLKSAGISGPIVHQSGAGRAAEVESAYRAAGIEAEVRPFIEDMASALVDARLVIARAGATTVAELTAVGRPAILVPYPHAADDHQTINANLLSEVGAASVIAERDLETTNAIATLGHLWQDAKERDRMAEKARLFGNPDAALSIVDDLVEWLDGGKRPSPVNRGLRGQRPYVPRSRVRRVSLPASCRSLAPLAEGPEEQSREEGATSPEAWCA